MAIDIAKVKRDAGQMVFGSSFPEGLDKTTGLPNTLPHEADLVAALQAGTLGGVLVFPDGLRPCSVNGVVDPAKVATKLSGYITDATSHGFEVPFLAIDQEGGGNAVVQRLSPDALTSTKKSVSANVTLLPKAEDVGAHFADTAAAIDFAGQVGTAMASEMRVFGFNLDFAPVADLGFDAAEAASKPYLVASLISTAGRAYSTDPTRVGQLALAVANAMAAQHIIPCAKHFPGHGATPTDSHKQVALVPFSLDTLHASHLIPFGALKTVPMMMVGHLVVTALDPTHPATLSPTVISQLLRGELGYQGVIISDDLLMKGAKFTLDANGAPTTHQRTTQQIVELGLAAGLDIFLSQDQWPAIYTSLVALGSATQSAADQIAASAGRVRALKATIPAFTASPTIAADLKALVDAHTGVAI